MNAIAEIDKAGRVVVPKKLRDALHLVPGTRLSLRLDGERLLIEPESKPRGLYMDRGTLVYDAGPGPATDAVDEIAKARAARMQAILSDIAGS
ncbi:MAG TPA: AbrB/MazE/SpoVT family DNA-binding domain-containing protein [Acidobacteriaceae bacterium]|jgi:AbrB family looped-hinge helix DNA binding protein|nr:AbrB/MazE/SpoVT family DNA-binding domain-containing protein [Acidobacteriaceae bacterium]